MKATDKPTTFLNVQVTAIPQTNPSTGKRHYKVTFEPASLVVKDYDTVINYQLVEPTPAGVKFKSVTVKPSREDQLSDPTISESGKLVTFSDANTRTADFHLTMHFVDDSKVEFRVDPEISNQPPPDKMLEVMLMPEIGNNPPPDN